MSEKKPDVIPPLIVACYTALDRAIKTLNLYMWKGELCTTCVNNLHEALEKVLAQSTGLMLQVGSEGLSYNDERFDTGGRTSHAYFHLFKDGLREFSFIPGLTLKEVQSFMEILVPIDDQSAPVDPREDEEEWEGDQRDEDAVTRLWEADFTHIRYHAIDAYAEGEIFDPERGFTRSLAEQIEERMAHFRPEGTVRLGGAEKIVASVQPKSLQQRGAMEIVGAQLPPEEHTRAWRALVGTDERLSMDRFAVIWGRLVQGARPEETETLAELMVEMFRDWMEEGNWDALIRALKVLFVLRKRDAKSEPIVNFVLGEISRPVEILRLLPTVEAVAPDDALKAVIFHKALGERPVELLCQMLQDVNIGRTITAFETAFRKQQLRIEKIHLARLKSREERILTVAIETLGNFRSGPGVSEALRPLLGRTEASVRHAALRALRGDEGPEMLKALGKALEAFDKGVRSYALAELVSSESDFARTTLLDRVESKEFAGLELLERRNLVVGMAVVGGEDIEDWFYEQFEKKSWFARKELAAHKAFVRECLEEAGTPAALGILEDVA